MASSILTALASVFTTYVPALGSGIYELFVNVFCEVDSTTHAVSGLNSLGITAVVLIGIGIVGGLVATIMGVLRLRRKGGKKRKAKR